MSLSHCTSLIEKNEKKLFSRPQYNTQAEALELLRQSDQELLASADHIRSQVFGNGIDLCAIINARSGNCSMDCAFCPQSSAHVSDIRTYPLLAPHELNARIMDLASLPVRHIGIVTSGARLHQEELDTLIALCSSLPKDITARLCTSLGRLSEASLLALKKCGIRRFHHNLETSQNFYPRICTRQRWEERQNTVITARRVGFVNCTGGLFGMGETWEDRIGLALALKALNVQHIPLNFLDPRPGTPLAKQSPLKATEALRIIALFRHILPTATLRICGGRSVTFGPKEDLLFAAGANALMVGDYLTTRGAGVEHDLALLQRLGLEPVNTQETDEI